jgi:hypothetical protein
MGYMAEICNETAVEWADKIGQASAASGLKWASEQVLMDLAIIIWHSLVADP